MREKAELPATAESSDDMGKLAGLLPVVYCDYVIGYIFMGCTPNHYYRYCTRYIQMKSNHGLAVLSGRVRLFIK